MNHAAARTPNVVTDTLLLDHGETETRPMPAPSISSASDSAEATKAPAMTAGQDTAEKTASPPSSAAARNAKPSAGEREVNLVSVMAISKCLRAVGTSI